MDEFELKLADSKEIILLKLGGSLLTDKNKPFSLREEILDNCLNQIIESKKSLILIHGGGAFGHPIAKKYQISQGLNKSIENQILGLSKTHEAMNKFNSIIITKLLELGCPAISIQPSSIFMQDFNEIIIKSIDPIEKLLDLGVIPVLYGDILLSKDYAFSILSGDHIILKLCEKIRNFRISKVIFAIEKDGIFIMDNENVILASKLTPNDLPSIELANLDQKIDVTGGIKGKLEKIEEIVNLDIPVQIINGIKNTNILKALLNQKFKCTTIKASIDKKMETKLYNRKIEHIKIPLEYNVQHKKNYFDEINLIHHPLPEFELDDINISVDFFNKKVSAPICIAAITGGHQISKAINNILANAAKEGNIIMSVGSQRIGLEDPSTIDSFKIVRDVAPDIPVIGNLGIGQICDPKFAIDSFKKCIEMINADVMAIHFNALHELVQSDGNISYKNFEERFKEIRKNLKIPIIAKEVGTGFNQELALKLDLLGFDGFDIGGTGGTSFAAIESIRDQNSHEVYTRKMGETFREWGIPTPVSIMNVRKVSKKLIIATGGLRSGVDIAKSIVLGADIGGFAYKFLKTAWRDYKANTILNTTKEIKTLKEELRSTLWLMNVENIVKLKNNKEKRVLLRELFQWVNQ
ncbi:MAG: type 2 isopentenyl-diphosphate Delta-isomerase [Promethearchaeota archaeon]|nr:MAG: type 2 isopentenyl-diphosphate Delta-isomerase [Candidatus Lokiarchaeota archaeon]